jgi:hypothetical protein
MDFIVLENHNVYNIYIFQCYIDNIKLKRIYFKIPEYQMIF